MERPLALLSSTGLSLLLPRFCVSGWVIRAQRLRGSELPLLHGCHIMAALLTTAPSKLGYTKEIILMCNDNKGSLFLSCMPWNF